jgi:hypothetical protein
MKQLIISSIEAIYLIYMFNYFKTNVNFAHPSSYFDNKLLYHPIEKVSTKTNMICPLGNYLSYIGAVLLILRNFLSPEQKKIYFIKYHKKIIFGALLLSLINFNAFIYLIPILIIEFLTNNYL